MLAWGWGVGVITDAAQRILRSVKRSVTTPSWWMYVIRHVSRLVEGMTPKMNLTVKYGLWVIMLCQSGFISCSKCPALLWAVGDGGSCDVWRLTVEGKLCTFCSVGLWTEKYSPK